MEKVCRNCKYWLDDLAYSGDEDAVCRALSLVKYEEFPNETFIANRKGVFKYQRHLTTGKDFGCNRWEPASPRCPNCTTKGEKYYSSDGKFRCQNTKCRVVSFRKEVDSDEI